jgi:hypothetical protein
VRAGILEAHARIEDNAAMRRLLEPLPAGIAADVRTVATPAGRGRAGMRFDEATRKAFWIQHATDGVLSILTFESIASAEVAAQLWAEMDAAAPLEGDRTLHEIYAQVTGIAVEPVGTRH